MPVNSGTGGGSAPKKKTTPQSSLLSTNAGDYTRADSGMPRPSSQGAAVPDTSYTGFGAYAMPGNPQTESNGAKQAMLAALSQHDKAGLAATSGHSGMDAARLQATGSSPYLDPGAPPPPPTYQLPTLPTMHMPGQDYNSYLAEVLKGMNLGALDKSYQDNINLIGTDTNTAVGHIGAAAQGAQQDIRGGTALLQQTGQQNDANNSALEAALSQQQQTSAQGAGQANSSLAQALGTGSAVGGTSTAAAQNAAAQQYLASAAQNNQQANDATTQAQVADNQNYGRVVDAKATSDSQNAQMAGRDAQSQVGLQRSQADLQARTAASGQAATMQQNAMQNAIAEYNAELQGTLGLGQLGQAEQGLELQQRGQDQNYGLSKAQFEAAQIAAQAASEQSAVGGINSALTNAEKYQGTGAGGLSSAIVGNTYQGILNDPYYQMGAYQIPGLSKKLLAQYPDLRNILPGGTPTYG